MPASQRFSVNKKGPALSLPKGFTLVELLVVVAIIAILSVIGLAFFGNVQRDARDTKRRGDIEAISKALETNYNGLTGKYSALAANQFTGGEIPADPSGTGTGARFYCYNTTADIVNPGPWTSACPGGWSQVAAADPPISSTWKVCASLEKVEVFCKRNVQ